MHNRRHLGGRGGAHDHPGGSMVQAPRLDKIGFLLGGVGNPAAGTHHRFDLIERRLDFHSCSWTAATVI